MRVRLVLGFMGASVLLGCAATPLAVGIPEAIRPATSPKVTSSLTAICGPSEWLGSYQGTADLLLRGEHN